MCLLDRDQLTDYETSNCLTWRFDTVLIEVARPHAPPHPQVPSIVGTATNVKALATASTQDIGFLATEYCSRTELFAINPLHNRLSKT
jgi:hypothetical protein